MFGAETIQVISTCFDFQQLLVLWDISVIKTLPSVTHVLKAATKTKKASLAVKHAAKERRP